VNPRPRLAVSLALAVALAAGGCSRLANIAAPEGGPPIEDISILDGRFTGKASFARGEDYCEREFQIALVVEKGRVKGEFRTDMVFQLDGRGQIIGAQPRTAPASTFQTYVDLDGSMSAIVYARSGVYYLQGRFRPDRYNGVLAPEDTIKVRESPAGTRLQLGTYSPCRWNVQLARVPN
jgi:hypothetical protein